MANEFLPPDPHAPAPPAPRPPAAPDLAVGLGVRSRDNRAFAGLVMGSTALALLVFTVGGLFFLTLPFSIAAWMLGAKAKPRASDHSQANVVILLGVIGAVLALVAGGYYIALAPVD